LAVCASAPTDLVRSEICAPVQDGRKPTGSRSYPRNVGRNRDGGNPPTGDDAAEFLVRASERGTLAVVRARLPLSVEVAGARAAGALSRLAGRGGGTTLPGKLLWKADPSAVDRLAARLPLGAVVISAT